MMGRYSGTRSREHGDYIRCLRPPRRGRAVVERSFEDARLTSERTGATMDAQRDELVWHRSTRCSHQSCLEVAFAKEAVIMRNSSVPGGVNIAVPVRAWRGFVEAVRSGDFGRPSD
ncbi:DUF397 domain-containing protein [Cryptosporangium sp. NPDC051539]|uniref:DUF397 domain-containing protein n=1 Tax=Cryptosporangium sp. NPDC051539 TaxID=3363962 RepID=UPI003792FBF2